MHHGIGEAPNTSLTQTWDLRTPRHETWAPPSDVRPGHLPRQHQIWTPTLPPYYRHLMVISGDLFKLDHVRTPTPHTGTAIWWWSPKHVRLASGRYASYWNAVLFVFDQDFRFLVYSWWLYCDKLQGQFVVVLVFTSDNRPYYIESARFAVTG